MRAYQSRQGSGIDAISRRDFGVVAGTAGLSLMAPGQSLAANELNGAPSALGAGGNCGQELGRPVRATSEGAAGVAGSLLNDPTRNPIASVAGGVSDVVVLPGVNHDRGAAVLEQRIRFALLERDGLVHERQ